MGIGINVDKAKEIQKDKIRAVRNSLLEKADVDYIRALESGDTEKVAEVTATKQALRDAPTIVDGVEITDTSVNVVTEELKKVWDETLLGPNSL